MSISNVSNASILAAVQALTTQSTAQASTSQSASSASSSSSGSSSAYTLSLGQQQATSDLLAYSQLGKLINSVDQNFDTIAHSGTQAAITDGNGKALSRQYGVDVQQLAAAQVVDSGASVADGAGTGTLSIQLGSYDSANNAFTAQGDPTTIAVTDGSLSGIASAINAAGGGVTAQVVDGNGQSTLRLTGPTGAANAFTVTGIAGLDYDPTDPAASSLAATSAAADAEYTVDGGSQQTSAGNTDVAVGVGVVATLTATGPMTVSAPLNAGTTSSNAQSLVGTFNDMLDGLSQIGDDTTKNLTKVLGAVVGESFGGKTLADIGITQGSDGKLSLDAATLQAAFTSDPTGTSQVIDQAAAAIKQALSGTSGGSDQVKSQMQSLVQSLMKTPSLIDYLNSASSSSSDSLASLFGGSSSSSSSSDISQLLASLTNGGSSSSSSSASSSSASDISQLLSALSATTA